MTLQLESAVVRIYANSRKVVGAGFLVSRSPQQILTCAHVLAYALGIRADSTQMPKAEVSIDFPIVAPGKMLKAKVIFWLPVNPQNPVEDIAVLELASPLPNDAQPAWLVRAKELWKHDFRVLGFPQGKSDGAWASGRFLGGIANGWVQIEDIKQSGYRLEEGFSGAPVWDEELQGVAGMAVAADKQRPEAKAAFIIPANVLVSAWDVLRERAIPPCPYRGLFAFREEDSRFFFGRDVFAKQLVRAVERQSLVAVVGASGSGKSSVVFAGLIPRLRQQGNWLIESFRPKANPIEELAAVLVRLRDPDESKSRQDRDTSDLAKDLWEGKRKVGAIASRILEERGNATGLVLIVDQFEELYTLCRESREQQQFLDLLLEAANQMGNLTLVLTLRADFFGYALSDRPFADALQHADVKLGPMNPEELRQIVEEPAKLLGVQIEAGLTDRILQAVATSPGNLPLLEFALTQLWEKQERGELTHEAYEAIGGVEKALANHAQTVYQRLGETDKKRAQRIFIQLVRPGEGTEDTRRLATREEVGEENWDLVARLADARLVVTGSQSIETQEEDAPSANPKSVLESLAGRKPTLPTFRKIQNPKSVEIVHEALIREWETLQGWMNDNRDFRVWQERLKGRIGEWEATNWDDGGLLRGAPLVEAQEWWQQRSNELSQAERDFIQQSLGLRDRLWQAEKDRQAKELAQEQKARKAAQRTTIAAVASLAIFVFAGGFTWWQRQESLRTIENVSIGGDAADPKLLADLPSFLKIADKRHRAGEMEQALAYYRQIITQVGKLRRELENGSQGFQAGDEETLQELWEKAETAIGEIVDRERMPELEQHLKAGKIGQPESDASLLDYENQYTEGALRTTYAILLRSSGAKADANDDGEINNDEEAARMPCETLKRIEGVWREYTGDRCGFFDSGQNSFYKAPSCRELNGRSLTETLVSGWFEPVIGQLKHCQIAPESADPHR